jgi:hypothetical protein
MGFATHLGPWLLGTIKNTTGTTVGSLENLGATVCSQTFKKDYTCLLYTSDAADDIL